MSEPTLQHATLCNECGETLFGDETCQSIGCNLGPRPPALSGREAIARRSEADAYFKILQTIARFPITDPKNQDAVNMQMIAEGALSLITKGTGERDITDEMVNAGARELWNDRDARHGGSWDNRDPREVCVIQTKATMRAALLAALSIETQGTGIQRTTETALAPIVHPSAEKAST